MKKTALFFVKLFFVSLLIINAQCTYAQTFSWSNSDAIHYDIHLQITDLASKSISGYTEITSVAKQNGMDSCYFYLDGLTIDSVQYEGTTISTWIHHNDSLLKIAFPAALSLDDTFRIIVHYGGQPILDPSGFGGFYFSSDNLYAYNLGVAFTDNPNCYGRVWFPCIDNFTDKALYDLYITTSAPQFAVCGGMLIEQIEDTLAGTIESHWKMIEPVPTYLVSVAVSDYICVADTFHGMNGDIPVHIYTRAGDTAKVPGSFANLVELLEGYEYYFGPYRWERVGYVAVPFLYGAMEHAMNIAYPRVTINGNLSYESLMAHELSHSWFGNAVTCATAPEMWINEGWASFSEFIYMEHIYGPNAAREYVRDMIKDVLHTAHIDDGGYWALHGVPHEITYGTTVYDKGALVVHAMRHYMGDSLFFMSVKSYLDEYQFSNITSEQLRDKFSAVSGIDMTAFFDAWVFRPGFSAFVVDSFHVEQQTMDWNVTVYFKQKLKGTTEFALENKFEVLFLGQQGQRQTENVLLTGIHGEIDFTLPFEPIAILVDPKDKTIFASTKYDTAFVETGSYLLGQVLCRLDVLSIGSDTLQLFVQHHWVAPDDVIEPGSGIYRISDFRYWEIDGIIPIDADLSIRFQYNRTTSSSGNLDNTLLPLTTSTDSLVLLYRPAAGFAWSLIPFTKSGTDNSGFIITSTGVMPGQYTLGIGEPNQSVIYEQQTTNNNSMKVFPNPSDGHFTIEFETDCPLPSIMVFNSLGNQIEVIKPAFGQHSVIWKPNGNPAGMYFIQLQDNKKKTVLDSKSVIYEK